jgi:hypothetical protein
MRRSILARVKFLSRLFTALNLLPSIATLACVSKLVVMFGLGTNGSYVREARKLVEKARSGQWRTLNEIAYTDGTVTFVHVEHFASQGALLPNWLGENPHERAQLGILAREAVQIASAMRSRRQ